MKTLTKIQNRAVLTIYAIATATLLSIETARADEPIIVYLTTEADAKALDLGQPDTDVPEVEIPRASEEPTPRVEKPKAPAAKSAEELAAERRKKLDDLIEDAKVTPLNKRQERIVAMIESEQREFLQLMKTFITTRFDPSDDKAVPEFNQIRDRIVELVMKAPDKKSFDERLYLINTSWLSNQEEALRFMSLDRHLLSKWQEIDEHRRRIRGLVSSGAAIVGVGIGGYLSYFAAAKGFAVKATDGVLIKLAKYGGRVPFVIAGAYVGATLGRYIGFLGCDYVFGQMHDYLDPIDGTEDLRDLLDEIDPLP